MRMRSNHARALASVLTASFAASSPVSAADLPPPPQPQVYDAAPPQDVFEGWWLGGTIGGATVNYNLAPSGGGTDSSGIVGGLVGGYSWQSGPWVVGVEGDIMAADVSGNGQFNSGVNQFSPSIDTMADLRLRAGIAVMPQVLVFATFGGAWANADLPVSGPGGGAGSADFFGWSAGAGAEVALNPNWAARFDYQFTDFNSETVTYPGGDLDFDPDASTYRGSLNYRF